MSDQIFDLMAADTVSNGMIKPAMAGRWNVLIARIDDEYFAINDRCSHAAARLSTGLLKQRYVMCPRHGARFDVATGRCLGAPYPAVRSFRIWIEDGRVMVAVPEKAPDMSEVPLDL